MLWWCLRVSIRKCVRTNKTQLQLSRCADWTTGGDVPVSVLWESRVLWCEVDAGGCHAGPLSHSCVHTSLWFFSSKYHKLLSRCVGSHHLSANERLRLPAPMQNGTKTNSATHRSRRHTNTHAHNHKFSILPSFAWAASLRGRHVPWFPQKNFFLCVFSTSVAQRKLSHSASRFPNQANVVPC